MLQTTDDRRMTDRRQTTDDRRTDDDIIANVNMSSRSLKTYAVLLQPLLVQQPCYAGECNLSRPMSVSIIIHRG